MGKHYKSVFENEQDLLKSLIDIHLKKDIECDPMSFKGNFYKGEINKPKYMFDINPQILGVEKADATNLPLKDESLNNIILDPPFLFGVHGKTESYYSSKTHTMFENFSQLEKMYKGILSEAYRTLKKKGICIFKCQDYTDSQTTMTHALVYQWALKQGFYAKDIAILVKPSKVYNGNTTQRHLRKTHTYFWVFEKSNKKGGMNGGSK